jgi:hypothetical protein
MDYIELDQGHLLEEYQPDWQTLESSTSEAPFREAGFYLLRELAQFVAVVASLHPLVPLDRNRAIIRGLVVRLAKLLRLTVRELSSGECFQLLSIQRAVLEVLGTLKYLIDDDAAGARFDQFVMNGLIAERELLLAIAKNVKGREGAVLHIEERMRRSIKTTAEAAGITDVSALAGRQKIGWPTAERRVELLGPDAYVAYRAASAETHGDWADLFRNHLDYHDGGFTPKLDETNIRPHLSLTPAVLVSDFLTAHANALIESEAVACLVLRLEDIRERAVRVTTMHESMLARI